MSDATSEAWTERQGDGGGSWIMAEVTMGGFTVRAHGVKGSSNWWWELFHREQRRRPLAKAQGGGDMTEEGAKAVALAVLGAALYGDGEK